MLTYQVRPRIFRHESGESLDFPAQCDACFHFQPAQPFGTKPDGGRTFVRAVAATALFNANSGEHFIESKEPLSPLDVTLTGPNQTIRLVGTVLTVTQHCEALKELEDLINNVYFGMPMLLNVVFADPPFIERVDGKVGRSSFRWELLDWYASFRSTTQHEQEERFAQAWERMDVVAKPGRRRLLAALHCFHAACRLARAGATAGEFVAEVLLNLSKCLEVLFPPEGDGHTRDAARAGLRGLDFDDQKIESDFLPAMALRNEIDVGHVELGLFTTDQLKTIHGFTERAETAFRDMFQRLIEYIESGKVDVAQHSLGSPRREALRVIDRLKSVSKPGRS